MGGEVGRLRGGRRDRQQVAIGAAGADHVDQVAGRQPGKADLDMAERRFGDHDPLGLAAVLPGIDQQLPSAHLHDLARDPADPGPDALGDAGGGPAARARRAAGAPEASRCVRRRTMTGSPARSADGEAFAPSQVIVLGERARNCSPSDLETTIARGVTSVSTPVTTVAALGGRWAQNSCSSAVEYGVVEDRRAQQSPPCVSGRRSRNGQVGATRANMCFPPHLPPMGLRPSRRHVRRWSHTRRHVK